MGAFAKSFRDLDVYQRALELVVAINSFCDDLPSKEKFALADQMRRASRSVCANIIEAWRKRRYKAAFISKMSDAETEAGEMQCWLDVAQKLAYMSKELYDQFDGKYERLVVQIITLINNADQWCTLSPPFRNVNTPPPRNKNHEHNSFHQTLRRAWPPGRAFAFAADAERGLAQARS